MKNRYGGYYVQMPSVQLGDRSYDVVEVISKELLEDIRRKVKEFYEERFKI